MLALLQKWKKLLIIWLDDQTFCQASKGWFKRFISRLSLRYFKEHSKTANVYEAQPVSFQGDLQK
jgi:hypothetical protein